MTNGTFDKRHISKTTIGTPFATIGTNCGDKWHIFLQQKRALYSTILHFDGDKKWLHSASCQLYDILFVEVRTAIENLGIQIGY